MSTRYEIEGFSAEDFDAIIQEMFAVKDRALELVAIEAWGNIKKESPVNEGVLASSWQLDQDSPDAWRIHTGVMYALYVHEGTEPGPRPFAPIRDWALKKGLPPGPIWMSIVQHGTKPNPYVERALESTRQRTDEFINRAVREITGGGGQ